MSVGEIHVQKVLMESFSLYCMDMSRYPSSSYYHRLLHHHQTGTYIELFYFGIILCDCLQSPVSTHILAALDSICHFCVSTN